MSEPGDAPCCSIGARSDGAGIDESLLGGIESISALAKRTGAPKTTLLRHRTGCLGLVKLTGQDDADQDSPPDGPSSDEEDDDPGLPPGRNRTGGRRLATAELELRCVELRKQGKGYHAIEQELGIPHSTAYDAVERVLKRTRHLANESVATIRAIQLERLEALHESLWERAIDPRMATVDVPADTETGVRAYDGQDKAAALILKICERVAKIVGLDAPQQKEIKALLEDGRIQEAWVAFGEVLELHPAAKAAVEGRLNELQEQRSGAKRLGG